eukprot:g3700.t1
MVACLLAAAVVGAPADADPAVAKASDDAAKAATDEAKKAGADDDSAKKAGEEASKAVKEEAAQEKLNERAAGGESGGARGAGVVDTPAGGVSGAGDSGASGASGAAGAAGPAGFVDPSSPNRVEGVLLMAGYDAKGFKTYTLDLRNAIADVSGIAVDDIAVDKMEDGQFPPQLRRRLLSTAQARLGGGAGMPGASVTFSVGADSLEQAKGNVEKLSKIGKVQSVAKQLVMYIRNKGAMKLVGVMLRKLAIAIPASPPAIQEPANITANTTTLAPTTTPAPAVNATPNATEAPVVDVSDKPAPKKELAFGAEYSWVSIGDEEIDAAARKVAEWSARAEYRILQEKKAYAAVMGTRAEVKDAAGAAKETVEGAVDNVEDPGDSVIRALEKSEEHTQQAKEARRRVKVLKEYRVKVSAKRKVATTTRDQAIADLLRLKVLRINSAKALWMTLANKVVELNGILKTRLEAAHKAAEVAKQSEDDREPQQVTLSKLHASQKAMEAGRQTKVYLNAVIYKTHCAEKLLHDWECKVQVNCTLSGTSGDSAGTGADKPSWSTPTLDALAEHMNEAVGSWKEAQK